MLATTGWLMSII